MTGWSRTMDNELLGRACRAYLHSGDRVPIPSWTDRLRRLAALCE